jgi:hypothetical protein
MPQVKTGGKTVSEKSTKGEIWEAYNAMLSGISDQPSFDLSGEKQESSKIAKTLEDLRSKFNSDLSSVSEGIGIELAKFVDFSEELNRKKTLVIKEVESKKEMLVEEIEKATKAWAEEESLKKKAQIREEEDYNYILTQKRRKEEDEYKSVKAIEKAEIAERKAKLTERESEIKQMEKDLAEGPKVIEEAINSAVDDVTRELTLKYSTETKELNLTHDHEKMISSLKIDELTKKVTEQKAIIDKIEKELAITNREAKEIAVSVIENRNVGHKEPAVG